MLLIGLFEQPEGLVLVPETRINRCKLVEIDISMRRQILEFLGDLQCISPPARNGINPTEAGSNQLVVRCNNFGLLRYFVVFADGLRVHTLHRVSPSQLCGVPCDGWIEVELLLVSRD